MNSTFSASFNYKLEVKLLDFGRAHVFLNDMFQFQFFLSQRLQSFTDSTQITVGWLVDQKSYNKIVLDQGSEAFYKFSPAFFVKNVILGCIY